MTVTPLDDRIDLGAERTPLEPLDRFGEWLGLPEQSLFIKRDDQTGLAGGGNKVRKLEYLCAEALGRGNDVLVTGGGVQSNHVRITAAAANRIGLASCSVLAADDDRAGTAAAGNVLLDRLLGTEIVWAGDIGYYDIEDAIESTCARLRSAGRNPYGIPVGGASVVGALGYVRGGLEIVEQIPDVDVVVVADGSGGTHAGLAAALGDHGRVLGVDVGTRPDLDERVPEKAAEAAHLARLAAPSGECRIDHRHSGSGYGEPTPEARVAIDAIARLEGVILDPVYTGKALAGLVTAVRQGTIEAGERIVFVHTGGMPALFSPRYSGWITDYPGVQLPTNA